MPRWDADAGADGVVLGGGHLVKDLESKAGEMSACKVGEGGEVYRLVGLAAGA